MVFLTGNGSGSMFIWFPQSQLVLAGSPVSAPLGTTMALDAYTRIVIRRRDGTAEVIGRKGHVDPHEAVRMLGPHGVVVSVRHEMMPPGTDKLQLVAIHKMED